MKILEKIKNKIASNPIFKAIYSVWMKIAKVLGWINTRIILSLVYFTIFSFARIILTILGKDLLNRKIDKDVDSYWIEKDNSQNDISLYLKQF